MKEEEVDYAEVVAESVVEVAHVSAKASPVKSSAGSPAKKVASQISSPAKAAEDSPNEEEVSLRSFNRIILTTRLLLRAVPGKILLDMNEQTYLGRGISSQERQPRRRI